MPMKNSTASSGNSARSCVVCRSIMGQICGPWITSRLMQTKTRVRQDQPVHLVGIVHDGVEQRVLHLGPGPAALERAGGIAHHAPVPPRRRNGHAFVPEHVTIAGERFAEAGRRRCTAPRGETRLAFDPTACPHSACHRFIQARRRTQLARQAGCEPVAPPLARPSQGAYLMGRAPIAQLVEHLICNQRVGSSSLSGGHHSRHATTC